jgi:transcriptional regulator with XRE-family HTH domain
VHPANLLPSDNLASGSAMIGDSMPVRTSHPGPNHVTTNEYLHALGLVFQEQRGERSVSDIANETKGRVSRATIRRLERGAAEITVRSQIELALFYGLTLADLHRRAWELLGAPPEASTAGTLALTLTREDRDAVLKILVNKTKQG